ncbi:MAG: MotA/TolQ/ExbB proton channel family protein [Azoarcus sp.]|jgi:biopolymer transport protein ExbB|nr:MotA/TolQ/ExbB proton channel family protein [Azoarcus sp.]
MFETSSVFSHFLAQTDVVGLTVLTVLAAMSLISWYVIALKLWRHVAVRARSRVFLSSFGGMRSCIDAERLRAQAGTGDPFARLLDEGLRACQHVRDATGRDGGRKPGASGFELQSPDDYVSAALAHGVATEARRLENGLTVLASIASSAPFIGLFGTVWGIFHALRNIALSAQASLDKVAGPVGEALIMTACGLFVAIPAVLAYNTFVRMNRNLIGELESHAHAVFGLLGLGQTGSDASAAPDARVVELSAAVPKAEGAR